MIQANELRIGNLVNVCYNGEIKEQHLIEIGSLQMIITPEIAKGFYFEPIPLTEEWLLKFEKINWIYKDINGIYYWFNGEKKYLKFVHSLQNTYFCIEQKEILCVNT